jgi:hypothetical protein
VVVFLLLTTVSTSKYFDKRCLVVSVVAVLWWVVTWEMMTRERKESKETFGRLVVDSFFEWMDHHSSVRLTHVAVLPQTAMDHGKRFR